MNKKIVGIITAVCVIAVAVFLLTGKKEVVVETPVEETVEEVTEVDDVETDEEVATETTQESESIVESETTETTEQAETTTPSDKEDTSATPVESTEVQEVYSADSNDKTPEEIDKEIEEMEKALEEAGLIPEGYEESSSGTTIIYGGFSSVMPEENVSVGIHF